MTTIITVPTYLMHKRKKVFPLNIILIAQYCIELQDQKWGKNAASVAVNHRHNSEHTIFDKTVSLVYESNYKNNIYSFWHQLSTAV